MKLKLSRLSKKWRYRLYFIGFLLILLVPLWSILKRLYPEMHMVMNSQCKIPTRNWNGKVLNIRVATNHMDYDHRPRNHNILHRRNATNDRRLSSNDNDNDNGNIKQKQKQHKIIVFGTHHRTGTHFAHKLFATICANQGWCCLMHPTRDSIDAIKASLEAEDVYVLGHSQWIWNPKEIFGENNDNDNDYQYQHQHQYRFFHFYRNPIKKIISGYLYHRNGMESWTQKQLNYKYLCDNNMYSIRNDTDIRSRSRKSPPPCTIGLPPCTHHVFVFSTMCLSIFLDYWRMSLC